MATKKDAEPTKELVEDIKFALEEWWCDVFWMDVGEFGPSAFPDVSLLARLLQPIFDKQKHRHTLARRRRGGVAKVGP